MRRFALFLLVAALGCFGLGFWAILNNRGVVLFVLLEIMAVLLAWAAGGLWDDRSK